MGSLIRIAAFMAANSVPEVLEEFQKARAHGATEKELKLCQSIARVVGEHAMNFSDRKIGERLAECMVEKEGGGACDWRLINGVLVQVTTKRQER